MCGVLCQLCYYAHCLCLFWVNTESVCGCVREWVRVRESVTAETINLHSLWPVVKAIWCSKSCWHLVGVLRFSFLLFRIILLFIILIILTAQVRSSKTWEHPCCLPNLWTREGCNAKPAQFKETRPKHPSFLQTTLSRNLSRSAHLHHISVIYHTLWRKEKVSEMARTNRIHFLGHGKQATNSAEVKGRSIEQTLAVNLRR